MNQQKFLVLFICLPFVFTSCFQSKASKEVDAMILAIGEVSLDSQDSIAKAEYAVNTLDIKDKNQLKNLSILESSRREYNQLLIEKKAQDLISYIDSIGEVTLFSDVLIKSARNIYDNASYDIRNLVTNYDILSEAEKRFTELKAENVDNLINVIKNKKTGREFEITLRNAINEYLSLNSSERSLMKNFDKLQSLYKEYK